jgi:hypothetical protein
MRGGEQAEKHSISKRGGNIHGVTPESGKSPYAS